LGLQGGGLAAQERQPPTLDLAGQQQQAQAAAQQAAMARAMAGAGLAAPASHHHPQLMMHGLPGQAIPGPTANLLAHPLFAGSAAGQPGAAQQPPGAGMILLPRLP